MNKKQLYLKTADYLDEHPEMFEFSKVRVPDCGSPGCIIGLMGMVHGGYTNNPIDDVLKNHIGCTDKEFYSQMSKACDLSSDCSDNWLHDAHVAAKCLRALADEMPDDKPILVSWDSCEWQPSKELMK